MTLLDAATALLEAIDVLGYTFKHPLRRDFEAALEAEQQRQERLEAVLKAARDAAGCYYLKGCDCNCEGENHPELRAALDALAALEVPGEKK